MDSPRRPPMRSTGGIALELSESSLLSRADSPYTDMESNYGCGDSISNDGWGPPPIERCMSCISKLGAMSRYVTTKLKKMVYLPIKFSLTNLLDSRKIKECLQIQTNIKYWVSKFDYRFSINNNINLFLFYILNIAVENEK